MCGKLHVTVTWLLWEQLQGREPPEEGGATAASHILNTHKSVQSEIDQLK